MPAKTHTMHGRDHCPGGADPIPCFDWLTGPGGAPVDYGEFVTSLGPIAYWRLGETGSPWADSSGHSHPLTIDGAGDVATLTADVTGALPAEQDDGAVRFNFTGGGTGTIDDGQFLTTSSASTFFSLADMTVTAFVKTVVSTNPGRGTIVANQDWMLGGGGTRSGWSLWTNTANQMVFGRGQVGGGGSEPLAVSPGPLIHGDWYHVAATYDGADMKLYLNGTLVDTEPEPSGGAAGVTNSPVRVGYIIGNFTHEWFAGTVDEVAIWDTALTDSQIAALAAATTSTGGADAGEVLTSDGGGGSYWSLVNPASISPGTDGYWLKTEAGAVVWTSAIADTAVWMPLTTVTGGVAELVWDGDNNLIPTLVST